MVLWDQVVLILQQSLVDLQVLCYPKGLLGRMVRILQAGLLLRVLRYLQTAQAVQVDQVLRLVRVSLVVLVDQDCLWHPVHRFLQLVPVVLSPR